MFLDLINFIVIRKYNIKRTSIYEHKSLTLHNLHFQNSILINYSLLRQKTAQISKQSVDLQLSYLNIAKNLTNVLCYISQYIKNRRTSNSCIIISDDTYDGNNNKVASAEFFKIKPLVLNNELKYNLLYKVIRPTSKIGLRFLITLFRNFYKDVVIK